MICMFYVCFRLMLYINFVLINNAYVTCMFPHPLLVSACFNLVAPSDYNQVTLDLTIDLTDFLIR